MSAFFKTFTNVVGGGLRAWKPKDAAEAIRHLDAMVLKAQLTGLPFGPASIFYLHDAPPSRKQDRLNSFVLLPSKDADSLWIINTWTFQRGGQRLILNNDQRAYLAEALPRKLANLGVWQSDYTWPGALPNDDFSIMKGGPGVKAWQKNIIDDDALMLWMTDGTLFPDGKAQTTHIALLFRQLFFSLKYENLHAGGAIYRMEDEMAAALHGALRN
jgi:hypothetical protein